MSRVRVLTCDILVVLVSFKSYMLLWSIAHECTFPSAATTKQVLQINGQSNTNVSKSMVLQSCRFQTMALVARLKIRDEKRYTYQCIKWNHILSKCYCKMFIRVRLWKSSLSPINIKIKNVNIGSIVINDTN